VFGVRRVHVLSDTGRLVGTGTNGAAAARVAIGRAQRQLALEANVRLHVRNFAVINQVGASSLRATLNCDAFAREHSAESHFDKQSFVGLAWRPPREHICCEIYSTGRANLPGSVNERQLFASFSRMLPGARMTRLHDPCHVAHAAPALAELLRFSSASHILEKIPQELQEHHRVKERVVPAAADLQPVKLGRARKVLIKAPEKKVVKQVSLWEGWDEAGPSNGGALGAESDEELDLGDYGL